MHHPFLAPRPPQMPPGGQAPVSPPEQVRQSSESAMPPPPQTEMSLREHLLAAQAVSNYGRYAASPTPSYGPHYDPLEGSGYGPAVGEPIPDDLISLDGKRKVQRELSSSKRAAQNRAAQRAFRERKEQHIKQLEERARDRDQVAARLAVAAEEINGLRDYINVLQDKLLAATGSYPQPPPTLLRDPNAATTIEQQRLPTPLKFPQPGPVYGPVSTRGSLSPPSSSNPDTNGTSPTLESAPLSTQDSHDPYRRSPEQAVTPGRTASLSAACGITDLPQPTIPSVAAPSRSTLARNLASTPLRTEASATIHSVIDPELRAPITQPKPFEPDAGEPRYGPIGAVTLRPADPRPSKRQRTESPRSHTSRSPASTESAERLPS